MKKVIKKLLREGLMGDTITAYRCIDGEYDSNRNGIQYFAINKEYASHFGDNCYKFKIDTTNANVLNLESWNKLYTEKTGKNGNLYNRQQGLFVVGEIAISEGFSDQLELFGLECGDEMTNKFVNEFNHCDIIYGEDAGEHEKVFAVKDVRFVSLVGKVI
jgi:hypothetical protein